MRCEGKDDVGNGNAEYQEVDPCDLLVLVVFHIDDKQVCHHRNDD